MNKSVKKMVLIGMPLLGVAILAAIVLRENNGIRNLFRASRGPDQRSGAPGRPDAGVSESAGDRARRPMGISGAGAQTGNGAALLEEWMQAVTGGNGENAGGIMQELIRSLRGNPGGNAAFYARVRQLLEDKSFDAGRKQDLIMALDRAATPAAVALLADLLHHELAPALKQSVLSALADVGEYFWDKRSLGEAGATLQGLWQQSDDPEVLRAVARAMAKTGDAASLEFLLRTVLNQSKSIADIERSNDNRVSAAWASLQTMHNPEVVPILQNQLRSSGGNLETTVVAELLAGMGQVEATQALLSWAQGAPDQYASIVRDAFMKISSFDSRQYLISAMAENPAFKSNLIREAILASVKRN